MFLFFILRYFEVMDKTSYKISAYVTAGMAAQAYESTSKLLEQF